MNVRKLSLEDEIFMFINNSFLVVFFLMVFYPILYIVSASLSSTDAVMSGEVWLIPVRPTLKGYAAVFRNNSILIGYGNSLYYTVFGTILNLFMTIIAAYPLSRKDFKARNVIMFLFTFTMMFSGGLIPSFLLIKNLNILNTRWAMIIPVAMRVWNVIVTRTYYQSTISNELLEAAQLDGCNDLKFMWYVVIPLSKAISAVMVMFYAVGHWNSFFNALIYLNEKKLYPLQIILRDILIMNSIDTDMLMDPDAQSEMLGLRELLKYALIIVASMPVLCLYPFVQKHFVKGIMIGAIKG